MKTTVALTFIFLTVLTFSSCGREVLTPSVRPKTIKELSSNAPIHFSYKVGSTQIDEFARNTGRFPIFGRLFQTVAYVLANATIPNKGGMELDFDPIEIELYTSIEDAEFDYIESIQLDSLLLEIDNAKRKDSLKFIEKVELYAVIDKDEFNRPLRESVLIKLVSFDKKNDELGCAGKCLNLNIEKINWKDLVKNNPKIKLQPKIFINSVPKTDMELAGSVSFSIKFNLGF